jgi:hypothetical protein
MVLAVRITGVEWMQAAAVSGLVLMLVEVLAVMPAWRR